MAKRKEPESVSWKLQEEVGWWWWTLPIDCGYTSSRVAKFWGALTQLSLPGIPPCGHKEDPATMSGKMCDISTFEKYFNSLCEKAKLPPRVQAVKNYPH